PDSEEIAPVASSSLPISTKANPRGRPVSRSITIFTSTTFRPPSAKTSRNSPSVTLYDKLPTYSLVPISFSFVLRFGATRPFQGGNFLKLGRGPAQPDSDGKRHARWKEAATRANAAGRP